MRLRNVEINWSKPMLYENSYYNERVDGKGLYYISRKFGGNEALLYIGKTYDCFFIRLLSHDENWLNKYRGTKYVRFGTISSPIVDDEEFKILVKDVESALIYELNPVHNTMSTKSYTLTYECRIRNSGYHGVLPLEINMRDHL